MTDEQKKKLKEIINFPVRCDEYGMYLFDSSHNMVADTNGSDLQLLRVRGWGRLSNQFPESEAIQIQKLIGDAFAEALNKLVE